MKSLKLFLLILIIPLGCSVPNYNEIKNQWSDQDFSYSRINSLVESIEINKDILINSIGIREITFTDVKIHKNLSREQILHAYNEQLNEVITAIKKVLNKTSKNYFAKTKIQIHIAPTTSENVTLKSANENTLSLTMGTHLNPKLEKSYIQTLGSNRLFNFMAKNIKSF